jgi:hypothetical protein
MFWKAEAVVPVSSCAPQRRTPEVPSPAKEAPLEDVADGTTYRLSAPVAAASVDVMEMRYHPLPKEEIVADVAVLVPTVPFTMSKFAKFVD